LIDKQGTSTRNILLLLLVFKLFCSLSVHSLPDSYRLLFVAVGERQSENQRNLCDARFHWRYSKSVNSCSRI